MGRLPEYAALTTPLIARAEAYSRLYIHHEIQPLPLYWPALTRHRAEPNTNPDRHKESAAVCRSCRDGPAMLAHHQATAGDQRHPGCTTHLPGCPYKGVGRSTLHPADPTVWSHPEHSTVAPP